MINIGLIGFGYWGPNLARNFNTNPDLNLVTICDFSKKRLEVAQRMYPQARVFQDEQNIRNWSSLCRQYGALGMLEHEFFDDVRGVIPAADYAWSTMEP